MVGSSSFRWAPGQGPDPEALRRMADAFPKPKKPMGEAWFLAPKREMYPDLLGDLDDLNDDQIYRPLQQIASGPSCFGQLDEWTDWYHYLLPRVMRRDWGSTLHHPMEVVISGFMGQHPENGQRFPYPEFGADALCTLGRCIMSPVCWPDGLLDASNCLMKFRRADGTVGWYDADGLLSASLFFCLKYLPETEVGPWFGSVIAIPNPYWRAQIIVWLIGANPILTDAISQPDKFAETGPNRVGWDWSYALHGNYTGNFDPPIRLSPFIPDENRHALLRAIQGINLTEFLEEWQTDPQLHELAAETAGMPDHYLELYGGRSTLG